MASIASIVGSAAVEKPAEVQAWLKKYGAEKIGLAFDVRHDAQGVPRVLHARLDEGIEAHAVGSHRLLSAARAASTCCAPTSSATARSPGPAVELYAEARAALSADRAGRPRAACARAADLHALAAIGSAAAISGKALLEELISPAELRPFLPNASSPASTSATARSSRAFASAITRSWATSSSSRERYRDEGADELVFYDITASPEGRSVDRSWVAPRRARCSTFRSAWPAASARSKTPKRCSMPARRRSPSTRRRSPIRRSSKSSRRASARSAWSSASTAPTSATATACSSSPAIRIARAIPAATRSHWVREVQERGAGEIVLNCMTSDGVRRGYDVAQLQAVRDICDVPLVASGGAGAPEHFVDVFEQGRRRCRAGRERVPLGRDRDSRSQDHARRVRHRGAAVSLDICDSRSTSPRATAWCPPSCRTPTAAPC